jgi:cation diffusion facilitator family transporter
VTRAAKYARLSILSNTLLIAMKLAVGLASGAVSIVSEAIHSLMDLAAAIMAAFSIRVAGKPADAEHPYGHGKVENVSGVVEALLIFAAAAIIVVEAIRKLLLRQGVGDIEPGIAVMIVSALVNYFVSRRLYKVAREEESVALEADALHLRTDVYSALGVAAGLILLETARVAFKAPWAYALDPAIAIAVALVILRAAWAMLRKAFEPLVDASLSSAELALIRERVARHPGLAAHSVRSRKAGRTKYVDFHLEVPPEMKVAQAHALCDALEAEIEDELRNTDVTIHVEPRGERPPGDSAAEPLPEEDRARRPRR